MAADTQKMTEDWNKFFSDTPVGSTRNWGGGSLAMTDKDGSKVAEYVDSTGRYHVFNEKTPFDIVAGFSPDIASTWQEQYGWSPTVNNTTQNTTTATNTTDTSHKIGNKWALNASAATTAITPPEQVASMDIPELSSVQPYVAPTPNTFDPAYLNTQPNPAAPVDIPTFLLPDDATVESRMKGLLAQGSDYMTNARETGLATANSRGLLNSSLAAEASQKAAIESALPIAQQDASAASQGILTGYQGEVTGALNSSKYLNDANLINSQAQASSQLSAQEATQEAYQSAYDAAVKAGLSEREAAQQANLSIVQGLINSGLSSQQAAQQAAQAVYDTAAKAALAKQNAEEAYKLRQLEIQANKELSLQNFLQEVQAANKKATLDQQLEAIQQTGANYRQEQELMSQEIINSANISSSEKKTFAEQVRAAGETFETQLVNIQRDPNVPAEGKTAAIAAAQITYMNTLTYLSTVYGVEIDWGTLATPLPEEEKEETKEEPPPEEGYVWDGGGESGGESSTDGSSTDGGGYGGGENVG